MFIKFLAETPFTDPRWRNGAFTSNADLSQEIGVETWTVRRWIAALERDGYIHVKRSRNGYRITLSKRIWYRHGKPVVSLRRVK